MPRKKMTNKWNDGRLVGDDLKWLAHATPDQIIEQLHKLDKYDVTVMADFGLSVLVRLDGEIVATGQTIQGALASAYHSAYQKRSNK